MFRRISLFVITNLLIMLTLSVVARLLGIDQWAAGKGYNYLGLLAFCAVWGFGGAFISLMISKWMAKMSMGVQVIDPR